MNSPVALYSSHSRLSHTAILTNRECLPRPVSWGVGTRKEHPILTSGQSLCLQRQSRSLRPLSFNLLSDPYFRISWDLSRELRGTGVTSKHYQLTPVTFPTRGVGGSWDDQG